MKLRIFLISIAVFLPLLSLAATTTPNALGIVPCNGAECQACHVVQLGSNIMDFLITASAFIAAIMVAVAGFSMVTSGGNAGQVSKAKGTITNVLIGFIILLAAWLIIDTVMKVFVQEDVLLGPWNDIQCVTQPVFRDDGSRIETGSNDARGYIGPSGQWINSNVVQTHEGYAEEGKLTQAEALTRLSAAGIEVKDQAKLEGITANAINEVIALENACKCNLTITEGTGGTHAPGPYSHANGYKLDLRTFDNPALVEYIQNKLKYAGTWSTGEKVYRDGCNAYAIERDHIDVQFKPSCQ